MSIPTSFITFIAKGFTHSAGSVLKQNEPPKFQKMIASNHAPFGFGNYCLYIKSIFALLIKTKN